MAAGDLLYSSTQVGSEDSGTTQALVFGVSVPAGSTVIIPFVNYPGGTPSSGVDSYGNTYTRAEGVSATNNRADIWYCSNIVNTGGNLTVTFTFSAGGNYNSGMAHAFEGALTLGRTGAVTATSTVTASAANAQADALVIGCTVINGGVDNAGFNVPAGYTRLWVQNNSNSTEGGQGIYKKVSAIETSSFTASGTNLPSSHNVIATFYLPSSGGSDRTGAAATTLGALTGSAQGTSPRNGTAATTLGALLGGGAAGLQINGTASRTLGALTGVATGTVALNGVAATTLGALTGAATGSLIAVREGVASTTLGALTGSAQGTVALNGVAVTSLGALLGGGAAGLEIKGSAATTLGALTSSAAGTVSLAGAAASTLGALTGSAQGTLQAVNTGTAATTLGALTGVATATPGVVGVLGFGDSTMAGVAATTDANRSINIFATTRGLNLLNKGFSGTVLQNRAASGGSPLPNNGLSRYVADTLGVNLRLTVVSNYGLNDLRYTAAPSTMNLTNFVTDYETIIDGWIAAGVTEIILCSPVWMPTAGYAAGGAGFTGSSRVVHEQYVAAIWNLAYRKGVKYAPVFEYMRDNGAAALVDADNIHPNNAGMAQAAAAYLAAAVPSVAVWPDIDDDPPVLLSAIVPSATPDKIVLTYSDYSGLSSTLTGAATVGGPTRSVVSETVVGSTVEVVVNTGYTYGDAPTITQAAGHVRDVLGNQAAALTARTVVNDLPYSGADPAVASTFSATNAAWITVATERYSSNTGTTTFDAIAQLTGYTPIGREAWVEMQHPNTTDAGGLIVLDESSGLTAFTSNVNRRYLLQMTQAGLILYSQNSAAGTTTTGYTFPSASANNRARLHLAKSGTVTIGTSTDNGTTWTTRWTFATNATTLGASTLYWRLYSSLQRDIYQPRQWGVSAPEGVVATTLGALTGVATGEIVASGAIVGSAAVTLGALTGAATGDSPRNGVGAVTLGSLLGGGAAGLSIVGTSASTLGALTGSAQGTVALVATSSSTLGALTGTATGTLQTFSEGQASTTLGALTGAAAGQLVVSAVGAAQLGALVGGTAGTVTISGVADTLLGALVGGASGGAERFGTASTTLGALVGVSTGYVGIIGLSTLRTYKIPGEVRLVPTGGEVRLVATASEKRTQNA